MKTGVFEKIRTELVGTDDTNSSDILSASRLVQWMDKAATQCAQNHSGKICIPASINQMDFIAAGNIGDDVIIKARISKSFYTSMEVIVQAFAGKAKTDKNTLIGIACFSFLAIDENAKAFPILPVTPEEGAKACESSLII